MSLIPEIVIQRVLVDGIREVRNLSWKSDQLFKSVPQSFAQEFYQLMLNTPIDITLSYPREDSQFPCIAILLRTEEEADVFLGDILATGYDPTDSLIGSEGFFYSDGEITPTDVYETGFEVGDPRRIFDRKVASYKEVRGSGFASSYLLQIMTDNQDFTIFLYHLVRYIILSNMTTFIANGIHEVRLSGTDFLPQAAQQPNFIFMRGLNIDFIYFAEHFVVEGIDDDIEATAKGFVIDMGIADQNSFGTLAEVEIPQIITISPASGAAGVTTLSVEALASATTIQLTDSSSFPESGKVLIGDFELVYYSDNNVGTGVLTLTTPLVNAYAPSVTLVTRLTPCSIEGINLQSFIGNYDYSNVLDNNLVSNYLEMTAASSIIYPHAIGTKVVGGGGISVLSQSLKPGDNIIHVKDSSVFPAESFGVSIGDGLTVEFLSNNDVPIIGSASGVNVSNIQFISYANIDPDSPEAIPTFDAAFYTSVGGASASTDVLYKVSGTEEVPTTLLAGMFLRVVGPDTHSAYREQRRIISFTSGISGTITVVNKFSGSLDGAIIEVIKRDSQINFDVTIDASAPTGSWDVKITNPDLISSTLTNSFTIL